VQFFRLCTTKVFNKKAGRRRKISTTLYAVALSGESRYNLINPDLKDFFGIGDKSSIEDKRLVDTLMCIIMPKIFLLRDEK